MSLSSRDSSGAVGTYSLLGMEHFFLHMLLTRLSHSNPWSQCFFWNVQMFNVSCEMFNVRIWELDYKESWAQMNWYFWTVVLEKTLESPLNCREIQPVHPKDQSWVFIGRTDVEAETSILWPPCEELTHLKRPWCWERLRAGREGDDWGSDDWMASLTQWTWVWVDSGSWWWTGRPGVLQLIESQRVGHDWATKLNWIEATVI